jgi:hypothetical protein
MKINEFFAQTCAANAIFDIETDRGVRVVISFSDE